MDGPDTTHAWGVHPGSRDPNRSRGQAIAWQGDVTQQLPKVAILPTDVVVVVVVDDVEWLIILKE